MSNFKGKNISFSVFGQSHSDAIGITVDGIPSGIKIDEENIRAFLKRRAPSQNKFSTPRKEADAPVFLSGILNGRSTGAAICAVIFNNDRKSSDYEALFNTPRPGHADYTARIKYGGFEDTRGGGAFSGRMTAPLCIIGAIAKGYLEENGITVGSHIKSIGGISDSSFDPVNIDSPLLSSLAEKEFPVIDDEKGEKMLEKIAEARSNGNSLGGIIECAAVGVPAGYGGELFDGIESSIAKLVFSVPAIKGLEFGAGFSVSEMYGSENNDEFFYDGDKVKTKTNNHGGILGGITSGMPVLIRAAVKPTPSIGIPQHTVDLKTKTDTEITIGGRHDACIVPRALPVLESCLMTAIFDEIISAK